MESETEGGSESSDESFHSPGNVFGGVFLSPPLQVSEGILELLRRKALWDTVACSGHWREAPGPGTRVHPTVLTTAIQKRARHMGSAGSRACSLEGKGNRRSMEREEFYNPDR